MKPLQGVRILELARVLAGPWAGQIMADLGAEVIKIERPNTGDDTRGWGPPWVQNAKGEAWGAAYYHACNRGKASLTADMKTKEGRDLIRTLAAEADVVVENFKVGGLGKYGLDHESLKRVNPQIITCSITGFGQDGPYAHHPGYDFMIQGLSGIMDLTGEAQGLPQKIGVPVVDLFTGVYAVVAILACLRRRDQTGEGAHIDMALFDTAIAMLANQAMNELMGAPAHRIGSAHPNIVPYQVFETADRPVIVTAGNDEQFRHFCRAIGADALEHDPAYATNGDRVRRRDELIAKLAPFTKGLSSADLLARLDAAGVPAGPVNSVGAAFTNPQFVHRGLARVFTASDGSVVPGIVSPIVIDGIRMAAERPSPMLGADEQGVHGFMAKGNNDA